MTSPTLREGQAQHPYRLQGRIASCRVYGDFFGKGNIADLEEALLGTRMVAEDVQKKLEEIDLQTYFGAITAQELTELVFS